MEGNVSGIDLSELLKARQELNQEFGIETDPNMYNNYPYPQQIPQIPQHIEPKILSLNQKKSLKQTAIIMDVFSQLE